MQFNRIEPAIDIPVVNVSQETSPWLSRVTRSVRRVPLIMLVAVILPMLLIWSFALMYQWNAETEKVQESLSNKAEIISLAMEREIDRSRAILETLAASDLIDARDWESFHRLAVAAIVSEPSAFIALTAPGGEQPVRTMVPFGSKVPVNPLALARTNAETQWNGRTLPMSTQNLASRVFETGRMQNSSLYYGVSIRKPAVSIGIPVMRDGQVAYVLIMGFSVERYVDLLHKVRESTRVAIIDASGRIIARNQKPDDATGVMVRKSTSDAIFAAASGTYEGADIDEQVTFAAFQRLSVADWTVNVSLPVSVAFASARRVALLWFAIGIVLMGIGIYSASRFWRLMGSLSRSESRLRTLFEHSGTGITCADLATGRFLATNRRMTEITGYTADELLERSVLEITHPDDRAQDAAAMKAMCDGHIELYETEKRYVRKDGSVRWIEVSVRLFPSGVDEPSVGFASIVDVTEYKRAEAELKAADQRKDEFLAILAHELRNPLAPLRYGIEMLKRVPTDAAAVTRVQALMDRQVTHMARLIDDLIDVSRISTGRLQLRVAVVDVAEVVRSAANTCQPGLKQGSNINLEIEGAPLLVEGDSTRLIQVVENLLNNAAKYCNGTADITVRAFRRNDVIVVAVRDRGIGIPADQLDAIFGMFSQVSVEQLKGRNAGLGLGLHIVRRLVELHGGTVRAESPGEGQGSEFIMELPAGVAATAVNNNVPAAGLAATSTPLDILVVDDNQDAAEQFSELLKSLGHRVVAVFDGGAGLEHIRHAVPDLVLLDLGMPGLDGYEVAAQIHRMKLAAPPYLAAISGWGQPGDRARTTAAGFDRHLVKPVDQTQLSELLEAAAARRA